MHCLIIYLFIKKVSTTITDFFSKCISKIIKVNLIKLQNLGSVLKIKILSQKFSSFLTLYKTNSNYYLGCTRLQLLKIYSFLNIYSPIKLIQQIARVHFNLKCTLKKTTQVSQFLHNLFTFFKKSRT